MKLAVQILAFNVDQFIEHTLLNAAPHVEKIYVVHPPRPWNYNPALRDSMTNPTTRPFLEAVVGRVRQVVGTACDIEIVESDWSREDETRNAILAMARTEGFDWMIVQDADEFYTEEGWNIIRKSLLRLAHVDVVVTPWFNFWKSAEFLLLTDKKSLKDFNACFAIRCASDAAFASARMPTITRRILIDAPCYHYGYVMSDQDMELKISSWGHANQIRDRHRWMKLKWLNWNLDSKYLHPVVPTFWYQAIRFPLPQPEFALNFMSYRPVADQLTKIFSLDEFAYDTHAALKFKARQIREATGARQ